LKKHTKLYFQHFGYTIADFICCEVCRAKANDLHHIESRGMGGSKEKDVITNLMALCRDCHVRYGDRKEFKEFLVRKHQERLNGF